MRTYDPIVAWVACETGLARSVTRTLTFLCLLFFRALVFLGLLFAFVQTDVPVPVFYRLLLPLFCCVMENLRVCLWQRAEQPKMRRRQVGMIQPGSKPYQLLVDVCSGDGLV